MTSFTFVHAADLHLDAPLPLPRSQTQALRANAPRPPLEDATFTTLDRLVELCLRERADVLLLAGDLYNSADSSLRARMRLREALARLGGLGVAVYLVHGNHDPLQSANTALFPWPDNVFAFSDSPQRVRVRVRGRDVADIYGVSHAASGEQRNLARLIAEEAAGGERGLFRIGLVHCALAGFSGAHAAYAPCTFADLQQGALDYWALGHVHVPRLLDEHGREIGAPGSGAVIRAAYPGSAQGLHINETGRHGCLVGRVRLSDGVDGGARLILKQAPLAALRWEKLALEPGPEIRDIPALEDLALEALAALADSSRPGGQSRADNEPDPREEYGSAIGFGHEPEPGSGRARGPAEDFTSGASDGSVAGQAANALTELDAGLVADADHSPDLILARLTLRGRTLLNHALRTRDALDDLSSRLDAALAGTGVALKDIRLATRPPLDPEYELARKDLAGEVLRKAKALAADPKALRAMADLALAPLFSRARRRDLPDPPDDAQLARLLEEAAYLCLDGLEPGSADAPGGYGEEGTR